MGVWLPMTVTTLRRVRVTGAATALFLLFQGAAGAQVPPTGTFRLATIEVNGDPRLAATVGDGQNDILDVHNGVRYLLQSNAPEAASRPRVQRLTSMPCPMGSSIDCMPATART